MKSRMACFVVGAGIWGVLACGCNRRTEPGDETRARSGATGGTTAEAAPHAAAGSAPGDTAGGVTSDTSAADSTLSDGGSGTWVELGAGTPQLSYVSQFVGSTPLETQLWRSNPLANFLYETLGPRYVTFLNNMQETGPIQQQNGVVYVIGNRKYSSDRAALAIDTATDGLYIWMLVAGKPEEYQWGDASITLPAAVRELVDAAGPVP